MRTLTLTFTDRLRESLVGDRGARFVLLGNFEVEEAWSAGSPRLPGAAVKSAPAIVNRMEELAVSLAGPGDVVVLKDAVDPGFARHLRELGLQIPRTLPVDVNHPERTVTADALTSPRLLAELRELADGRTHLLPLGTGEAEEQLSAATGLLLAVPGAAVFRRVNSKAYSRRLTDELALRAIPGHVVESVADLRALVGSLRRALERGNRIVVKEALGVSGKGVLVLDRARRLEQLVAMLERRAVRTGQDAIDLVVEEWVEKACDLNYQFVLGADGEVSFDFVKEALTERGVHKGHRIPSRLDEEQVDELRMVAQAIGARLFAEGYHGVVGVDAILGRDGALYPVLEINARFNMSTYQVDVAERFIGRERVALARHYALTRRQRLSFDGLAAALGAALFDPARGSGLLVNNFAAVNAAAGSGEAYEGRLYGLCIADSWDEVRTLDANVEARLAALKEA